MTEKTRKIIEDSIKSSREMLKNIKNGESFDIVSVLDESVIDFCRNIVPGETYVSEMHDIALNVIRTMEASVQG